MILGAGTGLDLEFLKDQNEVHAIDITPSMIYKLKARAEKLRINVDAQVMDGSNLEYEDNYFDAVILHLIVAVIPDPIGCLKETERVLKAGGTFTIMDKFIESGSKPSFIRTIANPVINLIATNINRDIDELLAQTSLVKNTHQKLRSIFWLINGSKAS